MSKFGMNHRLVLSYGVAVVGAVLAGLSPWWVSPLTGDSPPMRLLLVVVVTASAWLGGLGPGLLATAIGLTAIILGHDRPDDMHELVNRLWRFGSLALLLTGVFWGVHAQRRRADQRERERDLAERALREKESLLRSLYESSATAMGVIELAGDDARIVSANTPTGRLFGRESSEVEGQTAGNLGLPPDRLAVWLDHIRRCLANGRPVRFEERGTWPNAPEWIATTLSPMDSPGIRGDLCSFLIEVITERKRTEDDIRVAKEQAEAASRAKDRFLAVLSHELRTPLTPVLIAVSSMIESETNPSLLPTLEMIRRNIELESRLIDDLLDLSRIARGRLRLDLEVVDIHRALRRAVEICRDETFVAGLEVATELEARAYHVMADHARIMQIAWNLVRNAAKFTPAGGRLTIRTFNVLGEGTIIRSGSGIGTSSFIVNGPARLVVEFVDSGIGIPAEILPRIFEAFEQGRQDPRRRSQGLGLGLSICRSLAEAMGGQLIASSPGVGLGSTFRLELNTVPMPVAVSAPSPTIASTPAATGAPPVQRADHAGSPGLRILLVEDNADTLRYLATVLRGRGHDVVPADTIAAARDAARRTERPFDLLLSDIELPDGTGLELMRELRAHNGIRGIAMSGFGTEEDIQLSRTAGFMDHLIKPIESHRLDAAILRAYNADRAGEPDGHESPWSPTPESDSGPFSVISMHEP
jgi:PAS domain S-box-containing protein